MRNILKKVRKRDYEEVKQGAQAIYRAESRGQARQAFYRFRRGWRDDYPTMVRQLEKDLPELLSFFSFPRAPATDPADGLLCECQKRGPHYLLDLSSLEKSHPPSFYTSCLIFWVKWAMLVGFP